MVFDKVFIVVYVSVGREKERGEGIKFCNVTIMFFITFCNSNKIYTLFLNKVLMLLQWDFPLRKKKMLLTKNLFCTYIYIFTIIASYKNLLFFPFCFFRYITKSYFCLNIIFSSPRFHILYFYFSRVRVWHPKSKKMISKDEAEHSFKGMPLLSPSLSYRKD